MSELVRIDTDDLNSLSVEELRAGIALQRKEIDRLSAIVAALTTRPAISGYTCTVPDDCETLHWRGQILSMNELASVAQTEAWGSDDVQLDAAKSTAAIAWGWLWHVTTADDRVKTARHLLGQMLDKDLKRYGIQTAKAEGAQANVQEIEAAVQRTSDGGAA